ncbi:hypothetical protein H0H93_008727, partial [Arthromyces matolae]
AGHVIVAEYADKVVNKRFPTFPWHYAFGESQVVPKAQLPLIIQAVISSLSSPDSETTPNTLVLVAHGISGDLARMEEMKIKLPHNLLTIDTATFERVLHTSGARGPMNDPRTNAPRQSGTTISLEGLVRSLSSTTTGSSGRTRASHERSGSGSGSSSGSGSGSGSGIGSRGGSPRNSGLQQPQSQSSLQPQQSQTQAAPLPNITYHNSGNDAYMALYALQALLDPQSVKGGVKVKRVVPLPVPSPSGGMNINGGWGRGTGMGMGMVPGRLLSHPTGMTMSMSMPMSMTGGGPMSKQMSMMPLTKQSSSSLSRPVSMMFPQSHSHSQAQVQSSSYVQPPTRPTSPMLDIHNPLSPSSSHDHDHDHDYASPALKPVVPAMRIGTPPTAANTMTNVNTNMNTTNNTKWSPTPSPMAVVLAPTIFLSPSGAATTTSTRDHDLDLADEFGAMKVERRAGRSTGGDKSKEKEKEMMNDHDFKLKGEKENQEDITGVRNGSGGGGGSGGKKRVPGRGTRRGVVGVGGQNGALGLGAGAGVFTSGVGMVVERSG